MMRDSSGYSLPYRRNVGALIFRADGKILIARRADMPGAGGPLSEGVWQCPQGGIDNDEAPDSAVLREAEEEIGTTKLCIVQECSDWISYDFPDHLIGKAMGGRFRGQTQKWFALAFSGSDSDINLNLQNPPEFDAFRWIELEALPEQNVGFKKPVYEKLVAYFSNNPLIYPAATR